MTNLLYYKDQMADDRILLKQAKERLQMKNSKGAKRVSDNWKTQLGYYLMIIIPVLFIFVFSYIPMAGVYMAFIDYKPAKGILESEFIGLYNFKQFFSSIDFVRVIRNTLCYNVANILLVNIFAGYLFALLLYEIRSKVANKIFHTCMLLPAFLSWTVVSASALLILHPDNGMLNCLLETLGLHPISWYQKKEYWPYIIMIAWIYKDAGMSSVYYYSALLNIDTELFDAANLDGAGRIRQIWYISLPATSKVLCITLITQLGGILSGGISPFYELTFNNGVLYETTQVLGTYLYNGIGGGRFSFSAAVGLTQSVVGLILVLIVNTVIKRIDPESALF